VLEDRADEAHELFGGKGVDVRERVRHTRY
jgi:hypothetical protein